MAAELEEGKSGLTVASMDGGAESDFKEGVISVVVMAGPLPGAFCLILAPKSYIEYMRKKKLHNKSPQLTNVQVDTRDRILTSLSGWHSDLSACLSS